MSDKIIITNYDSPCGILELGAYRNQLCMCDWETPKHHGAVIRRLKMILHSDFEEGTAAVIQAAIAQLDEYFAGIRKEFNIPLLYAGTPFQRTVWTELPNVSYGTTLSYGALAAKMGIPKSVRALSNATGANSISIFVPCHRIIGTDGTLTGYAGGLEAKQYLLNLEASRMDHISNIKTYPNGKLL